MYDSERDNETLYFRLDYLNETLFKGTQNFTGAYIVMADRPEDVPAVARSIDDTFRNSTVQTRTESEQSFLLSVISYLGNVKLFLLAVSAALTGTVLLVSSNTMAMSVRERFAEVGVLRTLGFTRGNILTLIVGEALVVALAGAALGFCAAEALVLAMRRLHPPLFSLSALAIPPGALLIGAVLAAAIGVLSSAVPAWSAARRGIVDCLRIAD
jgi:putative ABC transport system permease protein